MKREDSNFECNFEVKYKGTCKVNSTCAMEASKTVRDKLENAFGSVQFHGSGLLSPDFDVTASYISKPYRNNMIMKAGEDGTFTLIEYNKEIFKFSLGDRVLIQEADYIDAYETQIDGVIIYGGNYYIIDACGDQIDIRKITSIRFVKKGVLLV